MAMTNEIVLSRHGNRIATIFDLLGHQENDITAAIGWALANCDEFLKRFLAEFIPQNATSRVEVIDLQKHGEHDGFTDIEICTDHFHIVVEAKCGWTLPTKTQLMKYAKRFKVAPASAVIVVVSECGKEYINEDRLPKKVGEFRVMHISYQELSGIAQRSLSASRHSSRRILKDLQKYLGGIMQTYSRTSNMVYVVALAGDTPRFSTLPWIDIVEKSRRYFHPVGTRGWPAEPPNYLGFRYSGRLQAIRYVESHIIVPDGKAMHAAIPEISARGWDNSPNVTPGTHFVYTLGPAIRPMGTVKSGNIRAGRRWAAIDLLLTSKSISQAVELTKKRAT